jgi:PAS domain S-box-containing protein
MEILTEKDALASDIYPKDILNAVPALVSQVNTELRYTYVNDAFLEFHKTTREKVIGTTVQSLVNETAYKQIEKYILKALHGEKVSFQILQDHGGDEHYFDTTYIPEINTEGHITGFISFVVKTAAKTDELLKKNEELKKSEERYHKMVDEVENYAIILLDENGNILDWNRGAEKIKGYKANEIIGQNFSIFYLPEDRTKGLAQTLINEARENGKAEHEGWRVKKDGTKFWGSIVITALHDDENNIIGFSKVTRDLTERKAVEEKQHKMLLDLQQKNEDLRKSEERYHKMIAEVEDYAIILLDRSGYIQNWNKGAENIKGYKADEIIGKNFRLFYSAEDRDDKLPDKLLQLAAEKGKAEQEGWRIRKDG